MKKADKAVRQLQHMGIDACVNGLGHACVRSSVLYLRLDESVVDEHAEAYDQRVVVELAEENPAEVLSDVATILDRLDLDKLDGTWDTDYVLSSIEYLKMVGRAFRNRV